MATTQSAQTIKDWFQVFKKIPGIYISLAVLLSLVVMLFIGNPTFLSIYNLKTIGNATAILLAVGIGQTIVVLTGGVDLSVGGIMSLISVIYILSLARWGWLGFLMTVFSAALMGVLNGLIFTRLRIPSFVTTLGTGGIFTSLAYLLSRSPLAAPARIYPLLDVVNGAVGDIKNSWIIALIVLLGYWVIQKYTYLGRTIYAIGSNEKMSWMSGLNITRTKSLAFVLSGVGAGISGIILSSNLYSGHALFGEVYGLQSIAVVVVGGTALTGGAGGILNTLVGALILSVIKNGMTVVGIDVYAQQTFLGLLIIIAVAITFDRSKLLIIK